MEATWISWYVSNKKERIIGAVTIMNEEDAAKVWNLIQSTFSLADVSSVEPEIEEIDAMKKYHAGDSEYKPLYSEEELLKQLHLD